MPLSTTTPGAIRSAIVTKIEALSPSTGEGRSEHPWTYLVDEEITGSEVRVFTILHDVANIEEGGLYGADGIEYAYEMRIRTAYGGLARTEADDVIWADHRDLWLTLKPLALLLNLLSHIGVEANA